MKRRFLIGLLCTAVVGLGLVVALQVFVGAALFYFEPSLPFATDPCAEGVFGFVGLVLLIPTTVSAIVVVATSVALQRPRLRRVGLALASGYMATVLASFLITLGPRFGSEWAPVRAAWAQSIDDDAIRTWRRWGPAMTIWIGERRVSLRLLERDYVRLDLGGGANMDVYLPAMLCTFSD